LIIFELGKGANKLLLKLTSLVIKNLICMFILHEKLITMCGVDILTYR